MSKFTRVCLAIQLVALIFLFGEHLFRGHPTLEQRQAGYGDRLAGDLSADTPSSYPYAYPIPNDTATGTTAFTLTKINASGNAVKMATTDTFGLAGVCVSGCGVGGTAWIAFTGLVPIISDGTATIQHYVTISATTAGDIHDTGSSSYPGSGAVVGRVQIGASGGSAAMILLYPPEEVAQSVISGTPIANQIAQWTGPTSVKGIDFPNVITSIAANCNNTGTPLAGNGWSLGTTGSVSCRAGTNNLGGFALISDTTTSFDYAQVQIPQDWDPSGTNCGGGSCNPFIRMQVASTDTTSGHTIIPQIKVSCSKGDGSTTDDVAFNAAHSLSTITLNTTANQFWATSNVQLNGTDMTGCVAGAMMVIQIGRATDTANNGEFYSFTLTFPRLLLVQAN